MRDVLAKIAAFHRAVGQHVGDVRSPDILRDRTLRIDLIDEERKELIEALVNMDAVNVADALADLVYVVAGAAVLWGIPLDAVFDEVHRSNMTKAGGPVREDGKILKGSNYSPPDIAGVLARVAASDTSPGSRFDYSDVPEPCGWPVPDVVARRPTRENPRGELGLYWAPLGETLTADEWRAIAAMILRGVDRLEAEGARG